MNLLTIPFLVSKGSEFPGTPSTPNLDLIWVAVKDHMGI